MEQQSSCKQTLDALESDEFEVEGVEEEDEEEDDA